MIGLLLALAAVAQAPSPAPTPVEPAKLAKDTDLIGREVVVDDRVRFFSSSGRRTPQGQQVFDELILKRTPVVLRLPPELRAERPPRGPAAKATGMLRVDGRQLYLDVATLEMMPPDLDRLNRDAKRLAPGDSAGRARLADWALRRANDFGDDALAARAHEVETEALLIDADTPKADDLALAKRAREHGLGDDIASGLLHRALRVKLDAARSAAEMEAVAAEIATALPRSTAPHPLEGLVEWTARMKTNPLAAYRGASDPVRAALDRTLLADALERLFDRKLADDPSRSRTLSDEARERLPDRPLVASRLREHALTNTEAKATTMRLSEVESLARDFREAGQPDRARAAIQAWLTDQRKRLNPSDAEGHVILAGQYDRLLGDRGTAGELLKEALKADPQARGTLDTLRRMGFRKSDRGEWYDPEPAKTASAPEEPAPARGKGETLRGQTPEQVRANLGKPTRVAREATQDATVEQWTYLQGRRWLIVVISRPRGSGRAEVVASYSLP
jgi:tetratricopeptide (TPR) repeat protein